MKRHTTVTQLLIDHYNVASNKRNRHDQGEQLAPGRHDEMRRKERTRNKGRRGGRESSEIQATSEKKEKMEKTENRNLGGDSNIHAPVSATSPNIYICGNLRHILLPTPVNRTLK